MTTYVMRDGQLVPKHLAGPKHHSSDAKVHVISDTMPLTRHMATGRYYDSKAKFRAETRALGCVEVGNDPAIKRAPPKFEPSSVEIVNDVKRAIAELRSR